MRPSSASSKRSSARAPRAPYRHSRSKPSRSFSCRWVLAWREKPSRKAHRGCFLGGGRTSSPVQRKRCEGRGWSASDSGAPGPAPGRCEAGPGARAPPDRVVLRLKPPQPREPGPCRAPHGRAAWAGVYPKGLRGFSTRLAHCSGGPRQRPSSAPALQPSPSTGLLFALCVRVPLSPRAHEKPVGGRRPRGVLSWPRHGEHRGRRGAEPGAAPPPWAQLKPRLTETQPMK